MLHNTTIKPLPPQYNNAQTNPNMQFTASGIKKPRKRKSTGDSGGGGGIGIYNQPFPMNNSNQMLGRSPKRLMSEEDFNPFTIYNNPMATADNHPSQNYGAMPQSNPMNMMGPMVRNTNSFDVRNMGNMGAQIAPQQINANFQSQTRVGANPVLPIISSSVVMVTESNSPAVQQSCLLTSSNSVSVSSSSLCSTSQPLSIPNPLSTSNAMCSVNSSLTPNTAISRLAMDSPMSRLANSVDSIIVKQESKPCISDNKLSGGIMDINTAAKNLSDFLGKHNLVTSAKTDETKNDVIKTESSKNWDTININEITVGVGEIKKEDQIPLQMDCEDIPNIVKSSSGRSVSGGLKGGNSSHVTGSKSKSFERDPFEFSDSAIEQSNSLESDESYEDDEEEDNDFSVWEVVKQPPLNPSSVKSSTSSSSAKHNSKYGYEILSKKERKKLKEYSLEESKKPMLGITVKINRKEGSAKAYVKQSPLHRSDSPHELTDLTLIGSSGKVKSAHKTGSMTPDRASDISMDSDVFVVTPDGSFQKPGGVNSASPRLLTSKKLDKNQFGHSIYKDKKKKNHKFSHVSDSKHDKKRKRATEEAMKKYDFDFNESEHLLPNKIKIVSTHNDGKFKIKQGTSKSYKNLSPLPMKTQKDISSSSLSSKKHKSVKQKKEKSEKNRTKSLPVGGMCIRSISPLHLYAALYFTLYIYIKK
jgi:hypothetical protein